MGRKSNNENMSVTLLNHMPCQQALVGTEK